jgi:DNA modification methylase
MTVPDYAEFLNGKAITETPTGLDVVPELNPMLFDFQRDIVRWALRRGRAAIFADCGLGKTPMQLEWARHVPGNVLILAPLAVSTQTVREGDKFGIEVRYCREQSQVEPGITITNYEMLDHFDPGAFAGVVLDECFAPDTMIDCVEDGSPTRKHVQDIRKGDKIINAVGLDTVSDVHRREVPYAVKVRVGLSHCLASPNHPFFTQRGWVGAQDLSPGDHLLETDAAMRLVRDGVRPEVPGAEGAAILRNVLFSEMAYAPARDRCESPRSRGGHQTWEVQECVAEIGPSEGGGGDRTSEGDESDDGSCGPREDLPPIESDGPRSFRAWGKWEGADRAAVEDACGPGLAMGGGIRHITGETETGIPDLLQGRLGERREENRNRGGWELPLQQESPGREEGRDAPFARVDGVEILEPGHHELDRLRDANGRLYFYDLGATRHPSYSVNGYLVHNSSILKAYAGKTRNKIIESFQQTPFRLACTATPAPNDFSELGNHSEFLASMTRKEMLSMFFTHDGHDTRNWILKGHGVQGFWEWLCSWAVMLRLPSDFGYEDGAFRLPPINRHQHTVKANDATPGFLFAMPAQTLQERLSARKSSIDERVALAADMINNSPDPWVVWCGLNDESSKLAKAIPDAVEVRGSDSIESKEASMLGFSDGDFRVMVTKPSIAGHGLNWQHCANMAFVGLNDSFEQMYQATRRCWRFGQTREVDVHIITSELEGAVVSNVERKERDAQDMADGMVGYMAEINTRNIRETRTMTEQYQRDQKSGRGWTLHNADCMDLIEDMDDDSVHFTIFSPPFQSLYTFSNSVRDMSNCRDVEEFYTQFGMMLKRLLRVQMPGRIMAIHVMDIAATLTFHGYIGTYDLHGRIRALVEESGWLLHGYTTIWKDPVTAAIRSKNIGLLYKQLKKDSCISRMGFADFLLFFRKPGDNPQPVTHDPEDFSLEQWQQWASPCWMDIRQTDTLPHHKARAEKDEKHIAPLQLEPIRRAVHLYSNPNDLVFSPFAGIGSEGYVAVREGRRFVGAELKRSYYKQAIANLSEARSLSLFEGVQ